MTDNMSSIHDLIIIGAGPAGITAGIYAARADLKPIIIAGKEPGGQLTKTTTVENFPGFSKGILGPQLMQEMMAQAKRFGAEIVFQEVIDVDFSSKIKKIHSDGKVYEARSVIIATGSSPRWLNLDNEKKFVGKGLSTCATCDGAFYKDKVVAIVGGGDSAMEESTFLTKFAKKVYLIHRREDFRASQIMQDRVKANDKIEILYNSEVTEYLGDDKLTGVKVKNNVENTEDKIDLDGLFLAIGHKPNTQFLSDKIKLDETGYIERLDSESTKTSEEGVFVAGDVYDHRYRQAITAAGMGCKAALDVEKYLVENE